MKKKYIIIFIIMLLVILLSVICAILFHKPEEDIRLNGWPTPQYEHMKKTPSKPVIPEMIFIKGGILKRTDEKGKIEEIKIKPFYIGKYEVTNKEYCAVYEHENAGDNLPVVNVSWEQATRYCTWLSKKTGLENCYGDGPIKFNKNGYRLPMEEEWEYACRGGSKTTYYWGDEMNGAYCWYKGNSGTCVHEIGKKKPNGYVLYDMTGNVSEWCTFITDKNPWGIGEMTSKDKLFIEFVIKGGSFIDSKEDCQVFSRKSVPETRFYDFCGFRLARTPEKTD